MTGASLVQPSLTQWGFYPQVPTPLVVRPFRSHRYGCVAQPCPRSFRSVIARNVHHREAHPVAYNVLVDRALGLARGDRTDHEVAQELGVSKKWVERVRLRTGLVRRRGWYAEARLHPHGRIQAAADQRILLSLVRRFPAIRSKELYAVFNLERQRGLRPGLSYTRFYVLTRGLAERGLLHAVRARTGRAGRPCLEWTVSS